MKKDSFVLALLALALCLCMLVSCASSNVAQESVAVALEPEVDPYPQATRQVIFKSQGQQLFRSGVSETGDFLIPKDPARENCTFNGWWVTCDQGVVKFTKAWLEAHPELQSVEVNARWVNTSYKMEQVGTMGNTQDGAIFQNYLMRFNASGVGQVYDMETSRFLGMIALDNSRMSKFKPHSNCVCFGSTYYADGDAFPLLYSNAYNNYDAKVDRRLGTVGAYRVTYENKRFDAQLVQVIRIGFYDDKDLWMSGIGADKSPYGNMVVDTDNGKLWFFVTRDTNKTTRFFCFDIPDVNDGEYSEDFGAKLVVLQKEDIVDMFDVPYSYYLQGACYHDGKIYSTEGMGTGVSPNVIRIIDLNNKAEDCVIDFYANRYWKEPEFVDFFNGECYYSDFTTSMYKLTDI